MFDDALTPEETWKAVNDCGPFHVMYADHTTVPSTPIKVWVVERNYHNEDALDVRPYEHCTGLAWKLVEATMVGRSHGGFSIDRSGSGSTGWYPYGNVMLAKKS